MPVSKVETCLILLGNYPNIIHQHRKISNCSFLKVAWRHSQYFLSLLSGAAGWDGGLVPGILKFQSIWLFKSMLYFPWELDFWIHDGRIQKVNYSPSKGNTLGWLDIFFIQLAKLSSSSLNAELASKALRRCWQCGPGHKSPIYWPLRSSSFSSGLEERNAIGSFQEIML